MKQEETLIEEARKRKEKYLSENEVYRSSEMLLHRQAAGKYIGDVVYGANDGIITTFAVVAGAVGASLSPIIVVILGFANLIADGISMGASNYLSKRSEQAYAKKQREKEDWEIDHLKELEVEEVREIYQKKGFEGKDLERAVAIITANRRVWLDTMMREELGIIEDPHDDPKRHGVTTFLAFVCAGFLPLIPYMLQLQDAFLISSMLGGLTLFLVGASRSLVTAVGWLRGGLEMFLVGSTAACAAFFIGKFIEGVIH